MAIKEKLTEQPEASQEELTDSEEKDLSIMVNLAKNMIDDEGINVIKSAENSKDQGQVIGQFLLQLGSSLGEKLAGTVDISPRILLIEGGWVEQVSDYLQEEYGIPRTIMDRAEMYIGGMAQQMATSQQQQAAGQAPPMPQEQAPPPQQPMPEMPQQGVA